MPKLPDEIVSEILSPALKVSEELFSNTSELSPFANFAPSTSAYLLVCKDWLRVGTPLLYNVVVLRSKAQANALAVVLQDNPEFGRFIKKLRVEGGLGQSMHAILKAAPNITDLFLSLIIWSTDNTSGLCKGLPLVNPRRVIVVDQYSGRQILENQQNEALRKTLVTCIQSWSNLRVFGFPYGSLPEPPAVFQSRAQELSKALVKSQAHTVLMDGYFISLPPWMHNFSEISSLKILQFGGGKVFRDALTGINAEERLKKVVQITKITFVTAGNRKPVRPDITPSLNPDFVPMGSASEEVRESVWKRVLFFALDVELFRSHSYGRCPSENCPSSLPILTVSKLFHRLGAPYLYESITMTSSKALALTRNLEKHPQSASFIRQIFTLCYFRETCQVASNVVDAIHAICGLATNLEVFSPVASNGYEHISVATLKLLAKTAGHSLQKLSISLIPGESLTPVPPLSALRHLEIGGNNLRASDLALAPDTFPSLETLSIHTDSSGALLRFFADVKSECLHTVILRPYFYEMGTLLRFFNAHGARLLHLTVNMVSNLPSLDSCPNLLDIKFLAACKLRELPVDSPHRALTKVTFMELPTNLTDLKFDGTKFPALRQILIVRLHWPTTEHDIAKSKVVPFAESLLKKDVKVTDYSGRAWVPRLKTKKTGKP
ncbi:hypothetical protein FB45DRAFT_889975 [Roridomyces roridus]|uniref:Uncharacterized protein n=1 Tax=Roridomyces roridus TaxID=1738132 RepID=A0AAD7FZM3_9AGAR|nr:hypothetical protein FB45DRAFT_889975 [Roridomyces roridus]